MKMTLKVSTRKNIEKLFSPIMMKLRLQMQSQVTPPVPTQIQPKATPPLRQNDLTIFASAQNFFDECLVATPGLGTTFRKIKLQMIHFCRIKDIPEIDDENLKQFLNVYYSARFRKYRLNIKT